jgi:trk system potassium uptake protein TrkA
MMVKEMGAKYIISKASGELHAKILTLIGVDKIVRPEYDMGKQIAHSLDGVGNA